MAEKKNEFRAVVGIIQFEPREAQAGGKDVRNIVVRQTGVHAQEAVRVSATVWPSHEHVALEEGDIVAMEGKFSVNKVDKDGETVTYYNLSVSKIGVLGRVDSGERVETVNETEATADDDDLPF